MANKSKRRARRTFSDAQKMAILKEVDDAPRGTKAAVVEKHGLASAQLTGWRKKLGSSEKATKVKAEIVTPKPARRGDADDIYVLSERIQRAQVLLDLAMRELKGL